MSVFVLPRFLRRLVAFALAGAFLPFAFQTAALARDNGPIVSGQATVIDGDTLEVAGTRVRLEGIDAPEMAQTCASPWFGTWDCGRRAAKALEVRIGGRRVDCERVGVDKYDRVLGLCRAGDEDLNAAMVRDGLAWAFVKYSQRYADVEAIARRAGVGVWQADTEPAWVYRERRWQAAAEAAPEGCAIKGNVTGNGAIYHMPWSPWYAKVKVEAAKGERWFCSEAEAREAGWRPAAVHTMTH